MSAQYKPNPTTENHFCCMYCASKETDIEFLQRDFKNLMVHKQPQDAVYTLSEIVHLQRLKNSHIRKVHPHFPKM